MGEDYRDQNNMVPIYWVLIGIIMILICVIIYSYWFDDNTLNVVINNEDDYLVPESTPEGEEETEPVAESDVENVIIYQDSYPINYIYDYPLYSISGYDYPWFIWDGYYYPWWWGWYDYNSGDGYGYQGNRYYPLRHRPYVRRHDYIGRGDKHRVRHYDHGRRHNGRGGDIIGNNQKSHIDRSISFRGRGRSGSSGTVRSGGEYRGENTDRMRMRMPSNGSGFGSGSRSGRSRDVIGNPSGASRDTVRGAYGGSSGRYNGMPSGVGGRVGGMSPGMGSSGRYGVRTSGMSSGMGARYSGGSYGGRSGSFGGRSGGFGGGSGGRSGGGGGRSGGGGGRSGGGGGRR